MNKYGTIFVICLGVLVLVALAGYALFEIYPTTNYRRPSVESLSNEYLALDRWLQKTGHPLKTTTAGSPALLDHLSEKTLLIQSSRFDWSGEAPGALRSWIEAGGNLVVFSDLPWYEDEEEDLSNFLAGFGITMEKTSPYNVDEEDEEAEETIPDNPEADPMAAEPALDFDVHFLVEEKSDARILQDRGGNIRMVSVFWGAGSLTVSGTPYFMWSATIGENQNARLAWHITGALDRENRGIYFIRGKEPAAGLWGELSERGNITPLVVSALILVITGFWMVIPAFGRPVRDEERPGKPIGERFRAESRFLRKYGALDLYLDAYVEELWNKLRIRRGLFHPDQMVPILAELWDMDAPGVEKIIHPQGRLRYRDFVNYIRLIENTEERL
ncbi:DUF4350 domain-containing protein [Treponema sp. TIM-1]|uniref:DUF4350 domain-containing protein n=1 Tax=Treponema sp. TIM-1 TaxID=2898417 RepID=UPI00397F3EDC